MRRIELSVVREIVVAEVGRGVVIDVENYCQQLHGLFPKLSRKEFEDYILQATMDAGGNAVWGVRSSNAELRGFSDHGTQAIKPLGSASLLRHLLRLQLH